MIFFNEEDLQELSKKIIKLNQLPRIEKNTKSPHAFLEDDTTKNPLGIQEDFNNRTKDFYLIQGASNEEIYWQLTNAEHLHKLSVEVDGLIKKSKNHLKPKKKGKSKGKKNVAQVKPASSSLIKKTTSTPSLAISNIGISQATEDSEDSAQEQEVVSPVKPGGKGAFSPTKISEVIQPESDFNLDFQLEYHWHWGTFRSISASFMYHFEKHVLPEVPMEKFFSMARLFFYLEKSYSNNEISRRGDGTFFYNLRGIVFEGFGGRFDEAGKVFSFFKKDSWNAMITPKDVMNFTSKLLKEYKKDILTDGDLFACLEVLKG